MAENVETADVSNAAPVTEQATVTEPQFANPLKRLALPALFIPLLGIPVVWGIVTFFQDASRVQENYRSLVQPPVFIAPPNMQFPSISQPQTSFPPISQQPGLKPAAGAKTPRR